MAIAFPLFYWAAIALSAGSAYAGPNPPKSIAGIHQDVWRTEDGLPQNTVPCLLEASAGDLWAGTDGGGLNRLYHGRFSVYTTKDGLADNQVFALAQAHDGTIWIGTHDGLSRFSGRTFRNYRSRDGLPNP